MPQKTHAIRAPTLFGSGVRDNLQRVVFEGPEKANRFSAIRYRSNGGPVDIESFFVLFRASDEPIDPGKWVSGVGDQILGWNRLIRLTSQKKAYIEPYERDQRMRKRSELRSFERGARDQLARSTMRGSSSIDNVLYSFWSCNSARRLQH